MADQDHDIMNMPLDATIKLRDLAQERAVKDTPTHLQRVADELWNKQIAAAERRADEAGFRRGLEAAAKVALQDRYWSVREYENRQAIAHGILNIPYAPPGWQA